jgi:hypothetical protein
MQQIQVQLVRAPVTVGGACAAAMMERALRFGCRYADLPIHDLEYKF